jgi:uncharacterized membrane-anchored protein YitT (DUF2179 family)
MIKRWKNFLYSLVSLRDFLGITGGTLMISWGVAFFLIPYKAAPGGVSSLSQISYYLWGVNPGTAILILNIPLFFIGLYFLGNMFGVKTIYAIVSMGLFTNLFSSAWFWKLQFLQPFMYYVNERAYSFTDEPILGVMAGAILMGMGLGTVFNFNGSCGSTDIPALLLRKYFGISVGTGYLLIDTLIIITSGLCFKNANLIFWGLFALFITSKVTDRVMKGLTYVRGVFIISEKHQDLQQMILHDIKRGCTVFKAEGAYTGNQKNVLYVVANIHELARLKTHIRKIDPKAFVIVSDVDDVWGEGFKVLT